MNVLVVVDMQNDFIDGALGTKEAAAIVPRVAEKIRNFDGEVLYTRDTHGEDYLDTQEGKKLPVKHCLKGTTGWELCRELAGIEGKRFEKDGFGSRACAEYVAKGNYSCVELVGLCTDICVISNAVLIKSFTPEIPVLVNAACCAGVTPESHQNALNAMAMCQIEILPAG